MSEPYSAFLKLQVPRGHLAQWLAAPVPAASRWSDWGAIGGQWYLCAGKDLAASSDQDLGRLVEECDAITVARGAADFFAADGHGLAVVHDYLWGEEGERETVAALGLSGQGGSRFAAPDEQGDAAGAFERMVETMLDGKDDPEFHPRDQLDGF